MIAILEWTQSYAQQNKAQLQSRTQSYAQQSKEQLQSHTMGVTINNESTTSEPPP